jgi:deoxycytidine triphosphate deaminase
MWVRRVSGERKESRIRQGHLYLFTSPIDAGWGRWLASLAKVVNMLPQTLHDGKDVGAILKILSQGATSVKVANN